MHPLTVLNPPTRILHRAQNEPFEFSLTERGVLVRNTRHPDPDYHEYDVEIVDGIPVGCTCPANTAFEGPCKHRVAVAIRPRLIAAVDSVVTRTAVTRRPATTSCMEP